MSGVYFNASRVSDGVSAGVYFDGARMDEMTVIPGGANVVFMHNHRHLLRCLNFFETGEAAVWEEMLIPGFAVGDAICSLSIDPDNLGAWLVTKGADLTTTGLFRTDNIVTGSFALTYLTQQHAGDDAKAFKVALGILSSPAPPLPGTFGEIRSVISMGNGLACVPETVWYASGDTTMPTAVFITDNKGVVGSWTISVPWYNTEKYNNNQAFWCAQYNERGCRQVEWDGTTLSIVGVHKQPGTTTKACIVTSTNSGAIWTLADYTASYMAPRSVNIAGGLVFCRDETAQKVIRMPSTEYAVEGTNTMGFRRTVYADQLVTIRYVGAATGLYVATSQVLISGGGIPVFGAARVMAGDEFITVAFALVASGEVVSYHLAGVHYDRTGNLLTEIGMDWEGTSSVTNNAMDSSAVEVISNPGAGVYPNGARFADG